METTKIEYRIISGRRKDVEEQIAALLNDGWELAGNIAVIDGVAHYQMFQPMIKYHIKYEPLFDTQFGEMVIQDALSKIETEN